MDSQAAQRGVREAGHPAGEGGRLRHRRRLSRQVRRLDKFWGAAEGGFGFCDVVFGWDIGDVLYDNSRVTGWHTGYPDTRARIDPATFRVIPWEPDTAAFLARLRHRRRRAATRRARGRSAQASHRPRATPGLRADLRRRVRVLRLPRDAGSAARERVPRPRRRSRPGCSATRGCAPARTPTSATRSSTACERFGIPIEGLHTETGPGVYEVAIGYDEALRAADKAALFKTAMKQIAARLGSSVTFMAKWNQDLPGLAAVTCTSRSVEAASAERLLRRGGPHRLSGLRAHYLAGQVALMPELTALVLAHRQQLQALRAGHVGAAQRELGRREPHLRHPRHPGERQVDPRRVPADGGRHEPLHRHGGDARPRASGASSTRRSRRQRSPATPRAEVTGARCRASWARPPTACRGARTPATCWARPSSTTTAHPRVGVAAVRARGDRVGAGALLREHLEGWRLRPIPSRSRRRAHSNTGVFVARPPSARSVSNESTPAFSQERHRSPESACRRRVLPDFRRLFEVGFAECLHHLPVTSVESRR